MPRARQGDISLEAVQPCCGLCDAFVADPEPADGVIWGFCHDGPGTPTFDADGSEVTLLPAKTSEDWCRRFHPKQ